MKEIRLDENTGTEIHRTLAGQATRLAQLISKRRQEQASELVMWRVPVSPRTVFRIEAIALLAADEDCSVRFEPSADLGHRDRAFLDDFLESRLGKQPGWSRTVSKLREWSLFFTECISALVRQFRISRTRRPRMTGDRESAVLIGTYGGEHVGDAAILGGVLMRLYDSGTREAVLMSHRPDHTRWITESISTPIDLSVAPYKAKAVDRLLDQSSVLVLAGGPLGDHPRLLAKHLAAIGSARQRGRPFLIEGIGIQSEFRRAANQWAARHIIRLADLVSVRSSACAIHPLASGVDVGTRPDPSFDYLSTRRELDLLGTDDIDSVSDLLQGTENRILVGINLKPVTGRRVEQAAYLEQTARGLIHFASESRQPVSYIFFPMEIRQSTGSDLGPAYRLHRLVNGKIDLRIWEAMPRLDAVLYLLRKLHVAITMRLHASIFALSQDLPVVAIDPVLKQGGKLTQLFRDLGRLQDIRTMEQVDEAWLVENLGRHHGH